MSWWRRDMENIYSSLVICDGNPPATGGFILRGNITAEL